MRKEIQEITDSRKGLEEKKHTKLLGVGAQGEERREEVREKRKKIFRVAKRNFTPPALSHVSRISKQDEIFYRD